MLLPRFKIHNTQLNRRPFTQNCFGLKELFYQDLQKYLRNIFKVKIGFSPEPMNDISKFRNHTPCEYIYNSRQGIQATKYDLKTLKNMAQNL